MVLFANNCQNEYEKQVFFKCSNKPQKRRCENKTLCDDSSILEFFKKVILKWVGVPNFWEGQVENRAKCGKWSFSQGLSREFFQVVPDT